ncbi:type I phosphodiesterase/nucleotide pyrophosphatase [Larkinella arboricola]|uniref:Type I phosphodiesterase/nucleotide pyrophosphatase n=1 Tax=Larkinella arboricola TaxID=643671 RepID=A0A327WTS1_LARAB|nr:alkaline phosphatase PafA [Larkinella arboricola]RAJ96022.1 type I phosphodiesterase/nucleotide pyrophosphatase [Larkinella arboricola]
MKLLYFAAFLLAPALSFGQPTVKKAAPASSSLSRPKLVVGIIVDQMRYDYLYRYYNKYSEGGFKRMMRDGFNARNNHYHYAATITAPGHTHVYTGSAPAISGIVGNDWYDRRLDRDMYCVEDSTVSAVTASGTPTSAGKMSPRNLLVTTVTDQLKTATQGRSKVIGVAMKDRGAILPAGHAANAAYWFDSKDGSWITSSFYMKEQPQWAKEFNARKLSDKYLTQAWETILPLDQYIESTADDTPFENPLAGEQKAVFPHQAVASLGSKYEALRTSPFGDVLTKEMALAALKGENMGKGTETDFLCVSFSSPDAIGHRFSPSSVEAQDEYLRLDKVIAELLTALDAQVGKGNYFTFLSADHGAADNPAYSMSLNLPGGFLDGKKVGAATEKALTDAFGPGKWISGDANGQIYLNHDLLREKKIKVADAAEAVRFALLKIPGVQDVLNLHDINGNSVPEYWLPLLRNVYHPKRSGDLYIVIQPGWLEGYQKGGTSHGTLFNYDTHVPLLFYGWGIKPGETTRRTHIADIASTVSALLHILEPSGNIGNPIAEAIK